MKRYCQTLELMDDPDMIRRYCDVHKHVWPEMGEGLGAFGRDAPTGGMGGICGKGPGC